MLKYTEELYARFGRKYCPTGKTGADWDKMEADIEILRDALFAYQLCASQTPHMDGDYTITGWNPSKLNRAFEKARNALHDTLPNVPVTNFGAGKPESKTP